MKLSIVVPAYNEEARIGRMLDAYLPFFTRRYPGDIEFIVSINGSNDSTEAIVRSYQPRHPELRVTVDPNPIGKGGAIIAGGKLATGQWIGFVDADGATPPEAFDDLLQQIGDA